MELVAVLSSIEAVVNGGKAVISADNSIIIAMMQEALRHGRSATFYVSPAQASAVWRWYGGQRPPVGAEGDGKHNPFMAAQHADLLAHRHLPQPRGFIRSGNFATALQK